MSSRLPLIAFLLFLVSCASEADDEIWMPPEPVGGKADAIEVLRGSDIPSPLVDPAKAYVRERQIASLQRVGALDEFDAALARRVDGIIASLPADGTLHVAELVRIGESPFVDALFADERARLPHLWTMLEAPDGPDVMVDLPAPAAFEVVDLSTAPGPLAVPPYLVIADLPDELEMTARRVQLVADGDGDASTVMRDDLATVIGMPDAFTPAEIEDAQAIDALFIEQATSPADARVELPAPGESEVAFDVGSVRFVDARTIEYRERRSRRARSSHYFDTWRVRFGADLQRTPGVELPAGTAMIRIAADSGREVVRQAPGGEMSADSGRHLLEVWQAGVRIESSWVVLPEMNRAREQHDLLPWVDYDLLAPGGMPLIRNTTLAEIDSSPSSRFEYYKAGFRYDLAPQTPPVNIDSQALSVCETPDLRAEPGNYVFRLAGIGDLTIGVYPQGVLHAELDGEAARMVPRGGNTNDVYAEADLGGYRILYYYVANRLIMFPDGDPMVLDTRLEPSMRDPS